MVVREAQRGRCSSACSVSCCARARFFLETTPHLGVVSGGGCHDARRGLVRRQLGDAVVCSAQLREAKGEEFFRRDIVSAPGSQWGTTTVLRGAARTAQHASLRLYESGLRTLKLNTGCISSRLMYTLFPTRSLRRGASSSGVST